MAAAVWGMEFYNEYLRGKTFVLYTDHKPLEKLGHLHTKTLNRLQMAMLEYDFTIQYKMGIQMPADYLSRQVISAFEEKVNSIDPFTPDLATLQRQDPELIKVHYYQTHEQTWPLNTSKAEINKLLPIVNNFVTENKTVWVRLFDENYPRTALFLPEIYRKRAICEAHGAILAGHDALKKTYIRLSSSYFWPDMQKEIRKHIEACIQCQRRKKTNAKPLPLQPLPATDQPNQRVHIDLFGPLKTTSNGNKMILCMTDAFTKYAEVIAIPDKQAETVANEIYINWICRLGTPVQIHSDNGKEFINNLSKELFSLLDIKHTHTTPAHPQCNAQVEVFNKTVAKYLSSFVDNTTLDWEQYIAPLMFSYNTSYHSAIRTTPYELLYGMKPRTPSLPSQDIQRIHYGESFASERLQILQKARNIANENIEKAREASKLQHDKKSEPHNFSIGQSVWYTQTDFLKVNKKLAPKWLGPALIIQINESVAKIKLSNNKVKTFNVKRLKHYVASEPFETDESDTEDMQESQPEIDLEELNSNNRPNTRAWMRIKNEQISSILHPEVCVKLNKIAFQIYHSSTNFDQLSRQEQELWSSYPLGDIFFNLTGDSCRPPDYNQYLRIRQSDTRRQQQQQQPQPQPIAPPRPRGRQPGTKNKPKIPTTRIDDYMVTRLQRQRVIPI
jgi:transposase InsO family protein